MSDVELGSRVEFAIGGLIQSALVEVVELRRALADVLLHCGQVFRDEYCPGPVGDAAFERAKAAIERAQQLLEP